MYMFRSRYLVEVVLEAYRMPNTTVNTILLRKVDSDLNKTFAHFPKIGESREAQEFQIQTHVDL